MVEKVGLETEKKEKGGENGVMVVKAGLETENKEKGEEWMEGWFRK
jgi:hypothetical protein